MKGLQIPYSHLIESSMKQVFEQHSWFEWHLLCQSALHSPGELGAEVGDEFSTEIKCHNILKLVNFTLNLVCPIPSVFVLVLDGLHMPSSQSLSLPMKQFLEQQSEFRLHLLNPTGLQFDDVLEDGLVVLTKVGREICLGGLQTPSSQPSPITQFPSQQSEFCLHLLYQSSWQPSTKLKLKFKIF